MRCYNLLPAVVEKIFSSFIMFYTVHRKFNLYLAAVVSYIKTDCLRFCSAACQQYQHSAAECEAVTRLPVPRPHMSTWLMTLRLHLITRHGGDTRADLNTRQSGDTRADLVSLLAGLEDDDTQKIRYLFK